LCVPELPELDVTRDRLRVALAGRRVEGTTVNHPAVLKTVKPPITDLHGGHLLGVTRRGKFLCLHSDRDRWLCVHLMLNGSLALGDSKRPLGRNHLLALHLDNGQDLRLVETGTKRRAAAHVVMKPEEVEWIAQLGLDPLAP
jgi:formamidopyrimidine-DNA glycosylase